MEDTHGVLSEKTQEQVLKGLNPYYNGRYSWSGRSACTSGWCVLVLILIIMEDTHGGK